jgi:molybdopterin converting factor subunit 1
MRVNVRLFASLRAAAGWGEKEVELPEGATVDSLLAHLTGEASFPNLSNRSFYVAVNQAYADTTWLLEDGDTVAVFPPVSGGTEMATDHGEGINDG